MRSRLAIVVAFTLLLSGVGWTALRVARLEDDAVRSPREIGVEPTSHALASSDLAPVPNAPPRVAASTAPVDASLAARLTTLEKRLDALEERADADRALAAAAKVEFESIFAEHIHANETAVIATTRNVISAQAQFQATARCDVDADRTGEYGGFLEMSGAVAGRMASRLAPPLLASAFQTLTSNGEVAWGGYLFRVFLSDARGAGIGEPVTGFVPGLPDTNLAETTWCLYAWPEVYGRTGVRCFFTNQGGDTLATYSHIYSGTGAGPAPDAAFVEAGSMLGRVAIGVTGSDGNVWKQVD